MELLTKTQVIRIDPLRVIGLRELIERTGYSRSTILKRLAQDKIDKAPGRSFPIPMRSPVTKHLQWREIDVVKWLEDKADIR